MFSDFQCPFCERFTREVLPELERRYLEPGRLAIVFKHLPLQIHPQAMAAATTAECAHQQGRFWPMHDRLFSDRSWMAGSLAGVQSVVGLDSAAFAECVVGEVARRNIEASMSQAEVLGVRSTPSFFVGARIGNDGVRVLAAMAGMRPAEQFLEFVDDALSEKPGDSRP